MERFAHTGESFAFGLSFVPPETLAPLVRGLVGPADALVRAAVTLRASFVFVPADEPWAEDLAQALTDEDIAPLWAVSGPLWPVLNARGVAEGLRATLTQPEEIGAELDSAIDGLLSEVDRAERVGARAFVLAEDLAGTQGPLVAPDFAIAELVPRYARVVRSARSHGLPALFHSDGDIRLLLTAIERAGFVGVHAGGGLDFDSFDRLFWAARAHELVVMGGMLTGELGNAARAEAIGSTVGVLAHAGGLFVSDDGGITSEREVAGLVTAIAAAREV